MPKFRIYYRIGMAAEKSALSDKLLKNAFHGICFSANVSSFGRTWVSQFINHLNKPFFIDPVSYTFQFPLQNISKGDTLKKSFSELVKIYGEPIDDAVSDGREIDVSDFNDNNIASMVENIFNFQKNIAKPETSSQKSLLEFTEWLDEEITERNPEFLLIPYFWFNSLRSEWYELNLKIIELAKENCQNTPMFGVICTNREIIFREEWWHKIASDFDAVDGIMLWLSDFNEYEMSARALYSYANFVQNLSRKKDIILMYGSYFSMVASKFGLSGISPGIGMSESKIVGKQQTGGTFSKKYYIPKAKITVTDAEARSFYAENPEALCTCNICKGSDIYSSNEVHGFFDELAPSEAKRHYCLCRASELREIENGDLNDVKSDLLSNIEFCNSSDLYNIYNIPFKHQARWLAALQEFD